MEGRKEGRKDGQMEGKDRQMEGKMDVNIMEKGKRINGDYNNFDCKWRSLRGSK